MLPLGKLPDAGQWDESELLVQGFKKKKGTKENKGKKNDK